jgi:L-alanine-DL-glutamate epimerase-like enolase superfamily enzyme
MKITDVSVTMFMWDGITAAQYGSHSPRTTGSNQLGLVRIVTDQGIEGHSFLGTSYRGADLDAQPLLMGQNPLDRERLYHALCQRVRSTTWRAVGAVDVALWDIAGKVAGLPIHRLLGSYRSSVRAYVSSSTLGVKQAYVDQALAMKEAGFTAYKIHPPADLDRCIDICHAVRNALGPDFTIMLDPSWAFDFYQAVRLGHVIQELNFYWYEDPLADDDLYNYVKLRQKLSIPIMATEQPPGDVHGYTPWIISQATDYLRGDVAVKGGITGVVKGAHLAEAFRMNYEVHHGGNSLNNVANLHAIMAMRNCEFFEVLLPAGAQKYGLIEDIEVDKSGQVHAMNEPGLGAKIDFDLIKRKTVGTLS